MIPISRLALGFLPAVAVVAVLWHWHGQAKVATYALLRMLAQLLLVGYVLAFLFGQEQAAWVLLALMVMLSAASWIALRTVPGPRRLHFGQAFFAVGVGGGATLLLITQAVLGLDPWFEPSVMIPLAGMVFGNAMNSVSLAGERLHAELDNGADTVHARNSAYRAALIPITNSLFAVGLVSLPGMMTGQILSGVSPLIAARYQILVMCLIFGSSGLAAALFLHQHLRRHLHRSSLSS